MSYRERERTPGLSYAVTPDDVEVPVVDVTHPAFELQLSDAEVAAFVAKYEHDMERFGRLPRVVQRLLMRYYFRGSRLAGALGRSGGTFLPGIDTYLMKLGPSNLGGWATDGDRRFAAAMPPTSMRLRLQDMAHLMAEALAPALSASATSPLLFLDIAGGPAVDALNALIVLRRRDAALLASRAATIVVLDQDRDGPAFGGRALDALRAPGAALEGVDVRMVHEPYDWHRPETLERAAGEAGAATAITSVSSEGGLFEYGDDETIRGNLSAIWRCTPPGTPVVGSVTRHTAVRRFPGAPALLTRPRHPGEFSALAASAGWHVERAIERPMSIDVRLARAIADA